MQNSYLFEEPENLLEQELREPAVYNSIISAVAGGASHSNEISTRVGIESGICAKYLKVLLDLGILKKETTITEKAGKKTMTVFVKVCGESSDYALRCWAVVGNRCKKQERSAN